MKENIEQARSFTNRQVLIIILATISIVFSGTLIYSEFILHGSRINTLDDRLEKKIKLINSNTERISELEKHSE